MTKREKAGAAGGGGRVLPYVAFLATISVVNLAFFYSRWPDAGRPCTTERVLEATALYLAHNGLLSLDHFLPGYCPRPSTHTMADFTETVTSMTRTCAARVSRRTVDSARGPQITLFTTHASHTHEDNEKYIVHNNTLINWAKFRTVANLILFTNDSTWGSVAEAQGWRVIKTTETVTPPLLRDMFTQAMSHYKTPWYGYINADILLTSSFIQTLDSVSRAYNASSQRVLLTGRRINVDDVQSLDASSDSSLHDAAQRVGRLYREDAEDYFIASRAFPWRRLLPVVVGVPGYDNWLVAEARCRLNATVVDLSETLEAIHQTTRKGGNAEGHSRANAGHNFDVFKRANVTPQFIAGLTVCTEFKTYHSLCDTVEIHRRTDQGPGCKCKKSPLK